MDFWESHTLEKNRWYHWKLGPCRIWIRRSTENELSVAFDRVSFDQRLVVAHKEEKTEELSYTRYVFEYAPLSGRDS